MVQTARPGVLADADPEIAQWIDRGDGVLITLRFTFEIVERVSRNEFQLIPEADFVRNHQGFMNELVKRGIKQLHEFCPSGLKLANPSRVVMILLLAR